MFRYKLNKQPFIIAALVILLCLVCLAGSTLALFTSDPEDGTIGVITTSGNIEVDIVDTTKEQNSLVNKALEFQTTAEQKELLFEPGAVFYTQGFKVKNTGDIPLKFSLGVGNGDIVDINNKKVDIKEFNEAFEVWIVENDPRSADAKEAKPLKEFTGELAVGECSESTYYLFVRMKESADNDFQGKTYKGIGVTVYAVQGNANSIIKE